MARRIKRAEVKVLALCRAGKNGLKTLYKADGSVEWRTVCKGDMDRGELLTVAYPLGLEDADGDMADTTEAVESMAHSFLRNGAQLDIEHDGKVLSREDAYVTESFMIQPGDKRFKDWKDYEGNPVDVTGGWAVKLQLDNEDLRAAYRNGEWDGVSLFGQAAVEEVTTKAASKRVAARMGASRDQENSMTPEQLAAILEDSRKATIEMVKSLLTPPKDEAKPEKDEVKDEPKAPTFTGDVSDPAALEAYENTLRNFELAKAVQSGEITADKIAEMRKAIADRANEPSAEELTAAGLTVTEGDSKEVRDLQIKLFKAQKRSERSGSDRATEDTATELQKSAEAEAKALAAELNGLFGGQPSARVVNS